MRVTTLIWGFIALFAFAATAQQTGMQFEHHTTWKAIQEKAKKENKYIFMDAFTTWCGPCKMMAAKIFPLPEVGEFFNANYINVKVQLDTTKNDNEEVKAWYKDAHDIMVNYNVKVFPTYLFFSPNGELVHRAVGSSDAVTFINKGKDALNPDKQYYTLARQYEAGNRQPDFLLKLAQASINAYDRENQAKYADAYLATQSNLFTEDNVKLLQQVTQSSKDKGFKLMMENTEAFDKVLGAGKTNSFIRNIIMQEMIFPEIFGKNRNNVNWDELSKKVTAQYPRQAEEALLYAKVMQTQQLGKWDEFAPAITAYMNKYGAGMSANELNSFAWTVFENCSDMACVAQALEWSKRSLQGPEAKNHMYMDTYANLLYKLGKKAEAIKAQEQTIAIAKEANDGSAEDYEATLKKMKAGEKTWN